ncbi:DNA-binding transcriptional regulator, AcrR family [Nocardioides scoriae]|uniref:DNA-binding transcriptional regulator, AcrR family n=1 Tax=Nocardioides scoriae TaxID=642780 RepID=A0A1H1P5W9_9ACTN|nr:TetR/AcrR family transcriptional regulator [Nocardioides scoriae]SDS06587.1 DNA-binding transcriptional regulator, AcrR family [Nocardioides scoriae]
MSSSPAPSTDGRATRWTGQQQRRRAEFVAAALVAIGKHGAEVSTEQIAAEAGVARTRLYRHFAGAHELNEAIALRAEAMLLEALAPVWDVSASPRDIIRTAVSTHLGWLTENHQLYLYLVRHSVATASGENVVNDVKRLISNLLIRLLDEYVEAVGLDARVTEPLSFGLVGFVDAAAGRWVAAPGGLALEEMVDLLAGWIWSVLDGVLRGIGLEIDPTVPLDLGAAAAEPS